MINHYLVSIVIPSKNRQFYLKKSIDHIISLKLKNVQLVVHDNSSQPLDSEFLLKFNLPNFKYVYSNLNLSFIDNFNYALKYAEGEYISIIGDDDGILPEIIDVANWAKINNIPSVTPKLSTNFYWPGSNLSKTTDKIGLLTLSPFNLKLKQINMEKQISKFLKFGGLNYLDYGLVKLYHGLVSKKIIDSISIDNCYFGGLSPDIYISIALSLKIEFNIVLDFPFTVPGVCRTSGSSDSASGKHVGNLSDAPHLNGHINYSWSPQVPKFYSVETIWLESAIKAINKFSDSNLLNKLNLELFKTILLLRYPKFKSFILDSKVIISNLSFLNKLSNMFYILEFLLTKLIKRIYNYTFLYLRRGTSFFAFDIDEAQKIISKKLVKDNINLKKILDSYK